MAVPAVMRDIPDRVLARYLEYRDPDTVSVILPTLKAMGRMGLVDAPCSTAGCPAPG